MVKNSNGNRGRISKGCAVENLGVNLPSRLVDPSL